jgi:hypothetical protein
MDSETDWKAPFHLEPGSWLDDRTLFVKETSRQELTEVGDADPGPLAQSKLLELLGLINFKILSGDSLYLEVDGAVYKVLYGVYWRSVFTNAEHYLLRCEEIAGRMWMEGSSTPSEVDLAIRYTQDGWIVKNCSLKFMVYRD